MAQPIFPATPEPLKVGLHREGSPYTDEECEEIIGKLEELLDGELDTSKEEQVIAMVNDCNYCLEQYHIEQSLRKLVKSGLENVQVNNELVNSIKLSIQDTRDHEKHDGAA